MRVSSRGHHAALAASDGAPLLVPSPERFVSVVILWSSAPDCLSDPPYGPRYPRVAPDLPAIFDPLKRRLPQQHVGPAAVRRPVPPDRAVEAAPVVPFPLQRRLRCSTLPLV